MHGMYFTDTDSAVRHVKLYLHYLSVCHWTTKWQRAALSGSHKRKKRVKTVQQQLRISFSFIIINCGNVEPLYAEADKMGVKQMTRAGTD